MKKILYVTNTSRMVNVFFIPHINMILEKGYSVDCACNEIKGHKLQKEKFIRKINFFSVSFMRTPWNFNNIKAFKTLYKLQKENGYDLIHVHSPVAAMFTRLLKVFFPKVKIIYTAHGFHFYKGSSKLSWILFGNIEKIFAKFTDTLITINKEDFEVAKTFRCKDVRKINGVGVDSREFLELNEAQKLEKRNEFGFDKDDKIFIIVGEHNKNKNQVMLLNNIMEINKSVSKVKFIFIGDGVNIEENKKIVKDKKIRNAYILGFRKDVNELINMSDVVVSMSYREGLPKNLLEALAVGKTILSTDIRGNNELVIHGENGFLFDVNNSEELKRYVIKLVEHDNEFFESASQISKNLFKAYELENVKKELMKVYC